MSSFNCSENEMEADLNGRREKGEKGMETGEGVGVSVFVSFYLFLGLLN